MSLCPAAIGIVLTKDESQILLVKRHDVPVWVLPGGGIEENELPSSSVKREIFEETGFHVRILRQCALYFPINGLAAQTFIFKCQIDSGSATLSDETREVALFYLNQLPPSFFFIHEGWLKENLNSSLLISRSLNEITYWAVFRYFLKHPLMVLRFAWSRFIQSS